MQTECNAEPMRPSTPLADARGVGDVRASIAAAMSG
jgi:hypothetical protein